MSLLPHPKEIQMGNKVLKICLAACLTVSATACNESVKYDDMQKYECNHDGVRNGEEQCDGADFGGKTCADLFGPNATGSLICSDECVIISESCKAAESSCGNGVKDSGEACDGSDFGGATCASLKGTGYTGTLACSSDCKNINTGNCKAPEPQTCNNDGTKDEGEACDGSDFGGATCSSVLGKEATGELTCSNCAIDSSACAEVSAKTCTSDDDCADDADGKTKCDETEKVCVKPGTVENCTSDADCADDADGKTKCDETEKVCVKPGTVENCTSDADCADDADGKTKCDETEKVCVKPAAEPFCGDGNVDEGEECDGSNLNGKSCMDFPPTTDGTLACDPVTCKFIKENCKLPAEGSRCTKSTFVESCNDNNVIWCYAGYVNYLDCGKDKSSCVILDTEDGPYADCYDIEEQCKTLGEEYRGCGYDDADSYSAIFKCVPGSDGNNYGYETSNSEEVHECGSDDYEDAPSCLVETGDCGKRTEDDGEECDREETEPRCTDDNIAVNCKYNYYTDNIKTTECRRNTCAVITYDDDGDIKSEAQCLNELFECDEAGSEIIECSSSEYLSQYICASGDNGKNYKVELDWESCDHGCDPEKNECIKLVEDEGEECPEDFEPHCEGNIKVDCGYSDEIAAEACDPGLSCVENAGELECLETCDEEDGTEITVCADSYLTKSICTAIGDGKYLIPESGVACAHGCDPDKKAACLTISDLEGTECDGTESYKCDDDKTNVVLACYDGVWSASACNDGYICNKMTTDDRPYCEETCDSAGDVRWVCSYQADIKAYASIKWNCVEDNGKKVWDFARNADSKVIYNPCPNGCNAEGNECLRITEKDGTACNAETDLQICDGDDIVLGCNTNNTWTAYKCADEAGAGTKCTNMGSEYGAYCYTPCENIGDESYVCGSMYIYSLSQKSVCKANVDGTANYMVSDVTKMCDNGCDTKTGRCNAPNPCPDTCTTGGKTCAQACIDNLGEGTLCMFDGESYDCGESCTEGTPDDIICNGSYAVPRSCTLLSDGTRMMLSDYLNMQTCTGTCTDGVGCVE